MFLASTIVFLYAESAVHAGSGSGLGAVDLPIQRERISDFPIIQASGVKGALRSQLTDHSEEDVVFGPENSDHAGALSPGDARVLLFPVRALNGVFVWVTCHEVLARFQRDAERANVSVFPNDLTGDFMVDEGAVIDDYAWVSSDDLLLDGSNIVLEEYKFNAGFDQATRDWADALSEHALPFMQPAGYWTDRLQTNLVVLSKNAFRDFVKYATEVVTRIKVDPGKKTVVEGALWTQELLPADTLLYAPVYASPPRTNKTGLIVSKEPAKNAWAVLEWAQNNVNSWIQIGGDETVGRGLTRLCWQPRLGNAGE